MMPGIGFEEMILLALMAIVVIGPKDLPLMMRKFGRFTGKMRAMAFEFKQGFDELGRQAELEELRREVQSLKAHTGLDDIKREFEQESAEVRSDVNTAMTHPAIAAPAPPAPASYAGLSADHPGYDTGEDNSIADAGPPEANGQSLNVGHLNGDQLNGEHVNGEPPLAGDPHIIPDDHAAPVKQDTSA